LGIGWGSLKAEVPVCFPEAGVLAQGKHCVKTEKRALKTNQKAA
jgi:hypothetical protein